MSKYFYLYSTKPLPDNNFCLIDSRCGGKFDLVLFISCLILGLCLLESIIVFIKVWGTSCVKNQFFL